MPKLSAALASEDYCYLTTTGRISGNPHTVEIWFAIEGSTLYILAGGGPKADFVRNGVKSPEVTVRINRETFAGSARVVTQAREDALARRLLLAKYTPGYSGNLTEWGRDALPFAVDLASGE